MSRSIHEIATDLRNLIYDHYIRKSQENFFRGYYSPVDIRRLLYNLRMDYLNDDTVKDLQIKLYELNIILNKIANCNATDEEINKICTDHNIPNTQLCKEKLIEIQKKLCPTRNIIYENLYNRLYQFPQRPYYGIPFPINNLRPVQIFPLVQPLPQPVIYKQLGGWPLTPPNSSAFAHIIDFVQFILDLIGLAPGVGAPFDIVSGIISLLKTDYMQALGSFIATIPIVGDFTGFPLKYYSKYKKYKRMKIQRKLQLINRKNE